MPKILPNILGITGNWGRWSEIVAVKLPDIISGIITFENILSIKVLKWLVILVGCKLKGINRGKWVKKIHLSDYAHYNSIG